MRTGSLITGIVTLAAVGVVAGMVSSPDIHTRRLRRKAMRAVNSVTDSLADIIDDAF